MFVRMDGGFVASSYPDHLLISANTAILPNLCGEEQLGNKIGLGHKYMQIENDAPMIVCHQRAITSLY